jgi:N-acetylglucosamine malate deacetylase 1
MSSFAMFDHERVLVLAPHTDDGEFGCGGAIARLVESGRQVFYAAFSVCEDSVTEGFPKDILETEVKQATKVLGIKPENLLIYRYPVRYHPQNRQATLQDLVELREDVKPDLVFMPSPNDMHQDHHTMFEEGLRAFKQVSILAYELPWNTLSFNTTAFIYLEERHISKKIEALKEYGSQKHRHYADEDFIRSLARTRGVQIGMHFAEAFEVIRWIIP